MATVVCLKCAVVTFVLCEFFGTAVRLTTEVSVASAAAETDRYTWHRPTDDDDDDDDDEISCTDGTRAWVTSGSAGPARVLSVSKCR